MFDLRTSVSTHCSFIHSTVTPASEPGSIDEPVVRRRNGSRLKAGMTE
jgi:hypothetical protein